MRDIFFISRVPRTLSLLLAGGAISVAGLIMQLLTQNRFVEPSLAGTTQSASLGLLVVIFALSCGWHLYQNVGSDRFRPAWYFIIYVASAKDHLKNDINSAFSGDYA